MEQDSVQYGEFSGEEKYFSQNTGQKYDQASAFHEYTMEISDPDFTPYEYESGCESFPECHRQQKSLQYIDNNCPSDNSGPIQGVPKPFFIQL